MISNINIMIAIGATGLVFIETLLCAQVERRARFALKALILALLMYGYVFLAPLQRMGVFVHLPMVAVAFLYVGLCYWVTPAEALFIGIAGYTIEHIASLVNSIISLADPERFAHFGEDVQTNIWGYVLIAACYVFIYALSYFLLIRRLRGVNLLRNVTVPIVILCSVMLVVNQIWGLTFELYGRDQAGPLMCLLEYTWNLICCVFGLCIQFGIFRISQTERELEVARQLIEQRERQYQMSKETVEAINRKCHNLKYELAALRSGQTDQGHIDEAMALVESFDAEIHTGNETLDVIFNEKNIYCRQMQINFVCMIDGEKLSFMESTDQYVLFGNMIDNAINAVRKLTNPIQRAIYIDIHAEKRLLLIRMENPFDGELHFHRGLPRTTSGDEKNHGFGMTSIRLICEKYGGSLNVKAQDGVFYLNLLLPLHPSHAQT